MDDGTRARWLDVQTAFATLSPQERAIVSVTILRLTPAEVATALGFCASHPPSSRRPWESALAPSGRPSVELG